MEHSEPRPGPDQAEALRRLQQRLDRASNAAEKLFSEAASRLGEIPKAPPAGWASPEADERRGEGRELEMLVQAFHSLRELIPPDLERRLAEALRELLLAVRALIDWYVERLDQRRSAPAEVQDIPII
jgi:hypothetical protein